MRIEKYEGTVFLDFYPEKVVEALTENPKEIVRTIAQKLLSEANISRENGKNVGKIAIEDTTTFAFYSDDGHYYGRVIVLNSESLIGTKIDGSVYIGDWEDIKEIVKKILPEDEDIHYADTLIFMEMDSREG
jgi:hypothetical protein